MIYGIGHDIVENTRISRLLDMYGNKFASKILSSAEMQVFLTKSSPELFLAKRFVAKEAFAKACLTGLRYPILMPLISVVNDELGKPSFLFIEGIRQWLVERGINHTHLSLSDEKMISSAFVILEY